jgi:hypothetical protein
MGLGMGVSPLPNQYRNPSSIRQGDICGENLVVRRNKTDGGPEPMSRWQTLGGIAKRPWFRVLLLLWVVVGAWNTIRGEFFPRAWAESLPNTFAFLADINRAIPLWGWFLGAALIFVAAALEYAHRTGSAGLSTGSRVRASLAVRKIPAAASDPTGRDTSVLEAIHYLAFGDWRVRSFDELEGEIPRLHGAMKMVEQAALDDLIPIWGRLSPSHLLERIPASFWRQRGIDWFTVLPGNEREVRVWRGISKDAPSDERYEHLMTNKQAVERLARGRIPEQKTSG